MFFLKQFCVSVLVCGAAICAQCAPPQEESTIRSFELRDQYETLHRIEFPSTNVTVLAVSDRKGSEQLAPWISQVKTRYRKRLAIEGIADVSAVPAPLRGFVRQRFKKDQRYPVMLDWSGSVARSLNYRKGEANIFVINRQGRITARLAGVAETPALNALFAAIDAALTEK